MIKNIARINAIMYRLTKCTYRLQKLLKTHIVKDGQFCLYNAMVVQWCTLMLIRLAKQQDIGLNLLNGIRLFPTSTTIPSQIVAFEETSITYMTCVKQWKRIRDQIFPEDTKQITKLHTACEYIHQEMRDARYGIYEGLIEEGDILFTDRMSIYQSLTEKLSILTQHEVKANTLNENSDESDRDRDDGIHLETQS
jgi:hypothetical protein